MIQTIKKWLGGKTKDFEKIIRLGWIQETDEGYVMSDIVRMSINLAGLRQNDFVHWK